MKKNNFIVIVIILFLGMVIGGMMIPTVSEQDRINDFEKEISRPNELDPLGNKTIEDNSLVSQIASGIGGMIEQFFTFLISGVEKIIEAFM